MLTIQASKRDVVGKAVQSLRRKGFIPAVVYGKGIPATSLTLETKEFAKIYKEAGENTLVGLIFSTENGGTTETQVLIHDVVEHSLKRSILHVDLCAVALDELTQAMVPLVFIDEAPAEQDLGGVIMKAVDEIEVEAFPQHLPHEITVSLSVLTSFDSQIHAKDIMLPSEVTLVTDPDMVLVSVSAPMSEEEIKKMEEEGAGGIEAVKVETEEKKLQREEDKTKDKDKEE